MARRLGQHFLKSGAVRRLLDLLAPRPADVFIEIGPGLGALTIPLAARCATIHAIELDRLLVAKLRERVPSNVALHSGDALTLDLDDLVEPGIRIVGNLPYYVGSPLVRRILTLASKAEDAHVMLQEEVARRIVSGPGSKDYGILSVLSQSVARAEIVLALGPDMFDPAPKVRSAVLRLTFFRPAPALDLEAFTAFLGQAFTRRRRTLENNLAPHYDNLNHHLKLLDIVGTRRPETLSVVEFQRLHRALVLH